MSKRNQRAGAGGKIFSRRYFLGAMGAGGVVAFMWGCENSNPERVMSDLPDPLSPTQNSGRSLIPDHEYAAPVPAQKLPPPVVAQQPSKTYDIWPRSMWAKAGPDLSRVDPMGGVRLITFHHSGDPKPFTTSDFGETAQHLEYVREYHRSRNFQDIGYHFAIDRAGRVWQLRSLYYQGQHVRYNNEHNIGVVVLGNFDMQSMTAAQQSKVQTFGNLLRKQYGLPISRIYTHQEIVSTECPGTAMQPFMVRVRRQGTI